MIQWSYCRRYSLTREEEVVEDSVKGSADTSLDSGGCESGV